jgi:hypothetical protein
MHEIIVLHAIHVVIHHFTRLWSSMRGTVHCTDEVAIEQSSWPSAPCMHSTGCPSNCSYGRCEGTGHASKLVHCHTWVGLSHQDNSHPWSFQQASLSLSLFIVIISPQSLSLSYLNLILLNPATDLQHRMVCGAQLSAAVEQCIILSLTHCDCFFLRVTSACMVAKQGLRLRPCWVSVTLLLLHMVSHALGGVGLPPSPRFCAHAWQQFHLLFAFRSEPASIAERNEFFFFFHKDTDGSFLFPAFSSRI